MINKVPGLPVNTCTHRDGDVSENTSLKDRVRGVLLDMGDRFRF